MVTLICEDKEDKAFLNHNKIIKATIRGCPTYHSVIWIKEDQVLDITDRSSVAAASVKWHSTTWCSVTRGISSVKTVSRTTPTSQCLAMERFVLMCGMN